MHTEGYSLHERIHNNDDISYKHRDNSKHNDIQHRVGTSHWNCNHLIWPTGIAWCCDWLTDQPQPAALLRLVVQIILQSFAAAKNRYPRLPYYVAANGGYSLSPLWDWLSMYPEEYLYTSVIFSYKHRDNYSQYWKYLCGKCVGRESRGEKSPAMSAGNVPRHCYGNRLSPGRHTIDRHSLWLTDR